MHTTSLHSWRHAHDFGQGCKRPGESRTIAVIVLTGLTMIVEVAAGLLFGSLALLADGLHMASHAVALSISLIAYVYTRRHAKDARYSFGTGKVNALGGLTGAVLLAVFALIMGIESVKRFFHPVTIAFDQAIAVAALGLLVNGASVFILARPGGGDPGRDDGPGHERAGAGAHDRDPQDHERHDRDHDRDPHDHERHDHDRHHHHHDHNLRSAYLHVLADALTSFLAIAALVAARYLGTVWMDPLTGVLGALLVSRWSIGLFGAAAGVLLDRQGPEGIAGRIREAIERHGDSRVSDLHLWSVGPGRYAAIVSVVASGPAPVEEYKRSIPADLGLAHVTVEVHRCSAGEPAPEARGD